MFWDRTSPEYIGGDSGVHIPPTAIRCKNLDETAAHGDTGMKTIDTLEFSAEIIGMALSFARNRENTVRDRIAALNLALQAASVQSALPATSDQEN